MAGADPAEAAVKFVSEITLGELLIILGLLVAFQMGRQLLSGQGITVSFGRP